MENQPSRPTPTEAAEQKPCADDFVVIASGEPFRFRRSDARGGAMWAYYWHKHQKSWVSSREVSDADAQRAFLTALPVEQAKLYEGGVPFLQNPPSVPPAPGRHD